ncbi:SGNH/GDSL hydrolase family protein [Arsenicicoccus dermatophilus]|uniref:SGNH/GDSL hydrolase family protein n=1 Tax=Arsenicicoccus dermatophilus TaxID=1076331 RepID=UPI0039173DC7
MPPARGFPTVVFYGDSIVTGWRGISAPQRRWSSLVCAELGWREVNLAIDGMGFCRRRGPRDAAGRLTASTTDTTLLDAAVRLGPDAVVVCLSANDLEHVEADADQVEECVRRDFRELTRGLPGVPVVAVTYFRGTSLGWRGLRIVANVERACAEYGAIYVEDFRRVVDGDPSLLSWDGIHPNDAGHRALADCILPTLRALDLGAGSVAAGA